VEKLVVDCEYCVGKCVKCELMIAKSEMESVWKCQVLM
jgi:hypothetical protein